MANLVKTVTLQIAGDIRDAAAKIGLITKDAQALADKSPIKIEAELTGSEAVKARLKEIEANAERLKKEFPEFAAKIDIGAASAKLAVLRAEIRKTADTGQTLSDRSRDREGAGEGNPRRGPGSWLPGWRSARRCCPSSRP